MNISKLFEAQRKLDDHIVQGKGLEGQDLLPQKILALQVELGELANEWRGFKFWSEDREPRKSAPYNNGYKTIYKNPLLEEYVDCLHFILSIGLELDYTDIEIDSDYTRENTTLSLVEMFGMAGIVYYEQDDQREWYEKMFNLFVGIGVKHLGFSWEQVEQAYMNKNKVNWERQKNGY